MKLVGNPKGISVLKALHQENKEFLKFLIGEAKSNSDRKTTFKAKDGTVFVLYVDGQTGDIVVT